MVAFSTDMEASGGWERRRYSTRAFAPATSRLGGTPGPDGMSGDDGTLVDRCRDDDHLRLGIAFLQIKAAGCRDLEDEKRKQRLRILPASCGGSCLRFADSEVENVDRLVAPGRTG